MKNLLVVFILILAITTSPSISMADDSFEFKFFGVDVKDFKDRNVLPMVIGAVSSLLVHEAGHMVFGNMVGMDTNFNIDSMVVEAYDYDNKSDDQKLLFHSGGFIAQFLVGGALTAINKTRHSDFNVGFNGFTLVNSAVYTTTGGLSGDDETSDIYNIDRYGANGKVVGGISSLTGGIFTYIALDKE